MPLREVTGVDQHYVTEKKLGKGGQGQVFLVKKKSNNQASLDLSGLGRSANFDVEICLQGYQLQQTTSRDWSGSKLALQFQTTAICEKSNTQRDAEHAVFEKPPKHCIMHG